MFDQSQIDRLHDLSYAQWHTLERLNRTALTGVRNLIDTLALEGRELGLDGELVLDTITGGLQVALGDAEWLACHLKNNHPRPTPRALQLRDCAQIWWHKEASKTMGRVISRQTGKSITQSGTPLQICYQIAGTMQGVRVEAEVVGPVTIGRPERKRADRTYDLAALTPASRERLQSVLEGNWPTRVKTAEGWVGLSSKP